MLAARVQPTTMTSYAPLRFGSRLEPLLERYWSTADTHHMAWAVSLLSVGIALLVIALSFCWHQRNNSRSVQEELEQWILFGPLVDRHR